MLEQCTWIVIGFDNFNLKSIPAVSNVHLVVTSCKTNNISRWFLNDYIPWGSHHENEESWAATLAWKGLESLLEHWCSCTSSERYLSSVHWWGAVCLSRICATWCHKQILIPYSWVSCGPVKVHREAGSSLFDDKKVCCSSCMDADRRRAGPLQPCQHAEPGPFSGLPYLTFGAKLLYLLNLHHKRYPPPALSSQPTTRYNRENYEAVYIIHSRCCKCDFKYEIFWLLIM